jgi:hypothetical protein
VLSISDNGWAAIGTLTLAGVTFILALVTASIAKGGKDQLKEVARQADEVANLAKQAGRQADTAFALLQMRLEANLIASSAETFQEMATVGMTGMWRSDVRVTIRNAGEAPARIDAVRATNAAGVEMETSVETHRVPPDGSTRITADHRSGAGDHSERYCRR